LRVGLVIYPGEGEDEDLTARFKSLVLTESRGTVLVWDRWRREPAPLATDEGIRRLARWVRAAKLDVLVLDTATSFARGRYDTSKGLPESYADALGSLRSLAQRRLAIVHIQHTRKIDRRASSPADELEEISGTFARKVDAAIVIRKDGERETHRRITFAKTRTGPKPPGLIAQLPALTSDEPPRLTVIGSTSRAVKDGTDADLIAAWIRDQTEPQAGTVIRAVFSLSERTFRNRRDALEARGVRQGRAPWLGGNAYAFGTDDQWKSKLGIPLAEFDKDAGDDV
jgi:hypothetical protein